MRKMTKGKPSVPLNTLEKALQLAHVLRQDLNRGGSQTSWGFRVFSAFTADELEALAAFFIWRARGETIKELTDQQ